jgi:hypothetical protein
MESHLSASTTVADYAAVILVLLLSVAFPTITQAQTTALLLFGGEAHRDFLGCLNCSEFTSASVCNEFGTYGSEFSSSSIWNEFSAFGSEFSNLSPWNEFSGTAPVIVDNKGKFYGYLSVNEFHPQRTRLAAVVDLLRVAKKIANRKAIRDYLCK